MTVLVRDQCPIESTCDVMLSRPEDKTAFRASSLRRKRFRRVSASLKDLSLFGRAKIREK